MRCIEARPELEREGSRFNSAWSAVLALPQVRGAATSKLSGQGF